MGLKYIVPTALCLLEEAPLLSSGLYKGDLLLAILKVPEEFWSENLDLNNRLMEVKIDIEEVYNTLTEDILPLMKTIEFK